MKKTIQISLLVLALGLVGGQFVKPDRDIPTYDSMDDIMSIEVGSEEVSKAFKRACYDCHSYETAYPWYAEVFPLSFWIQKHVDEGREELNFSEWASYSAKRKKHKLEECIEEVEKNHMPLKSYTWMHTRSNWTQEEEVLVMEWWKSLKSQY